MKVTARLIRQILFIYLLAFLIIKLQAYAQTPDQPPSATQNTHREGMGAVKMAPTHELTHDGKLKPTKGKKMYAILETSMGNVKFLLLNHEAPKTVSNFVGLAKGTKQFVDPRTHAKTKKHFYDGLIFHRVIEGFMIQGGDPLGNGTGGPGYKFDDEISTIHHFDKPGIVAMANAGPNTNGCQFFITVSEQDHLNGHYSIFGEVVEGMDVVMAISKVKTDPRDKPINDVIIKKVDIVNE